MGKAARLKQQRHIAPPPSSTVGRTVHIEPKIVWLATAGVVAIVAVVVGVLLATRSSPKVAPPAPVTAADKNAPAALVAAADQVGFHPTTEPGSGLVENQPASAAQAPTNPDLLAVGSVAPNFTLKTPQGRSVSLSAYRGKAVLLEFFATWCPHCNAETPYLERLAQSLAGKNVQFLSVNADGETAPSVYAYHRYYGLSFPTLLDPSGTPGTFTSPGAAGRISTAYRIRSFPTFYVVDRNGKVTWRSEGEQPDALLRSLLLEAARA